MGKIRHENPWMMKWKGERGNFIQYGPIHPLIDWRLSKDIKKDKDKAIWKKAFKCRGPEEKVAWWVQASAKRLTILEESEGNSIKCGQGEDKGGLRTQSHILVGHLKTWAFTNLNSYLHD